MKAFGVLALKPALVAALAMGAACLVAATAAVAQSGQSRPQASFSIPLRPPADEEAAARRVLDELFDRLAKARDAEEGAGIAGAIQRVWLRSGSDTADLLMARARATLNSKDAAKDSAVALEILDRLVVLEPEWSEAWRLRANARFLSADKAGAVEDLARTLTIEPRHFAALADLGSILHASGFNKRALEVLRRALEVHPQQSDAKALADQLSLSVDGRGI
jgi:tetratricopeptide (TPR) repeat protein